MTWDEWWARYRSKEKAGSSSPWIRACRACDCPTSYGRALCNECSELGVMWCSETGHLLSPGTPVNVQIGRKTRKRIRTRCIACIKERRACCKYNLKIGEYTMLKSLAVECGFCGGVFDLSSVHGNWAPVLDHNHATGVNRGFLHQVCNKTMGGLECIAKKRERSMYNVAMMAGRYEKNSRNGELILGDAA